MARSWIDNTRARAYAKRLQAAADHVEPAAKAVAEKHLAAPLRARVAAEPGGKDLAKQIKVLVNDNGVSVGAEGEAGEALNNLEIGTMDRPPTAHGLHVALDNHDIVNKEFWREAMRRAK